MQIEVSNINSSVIKKIAYDSTLNQLLIEFASSSFVYSEVDQDTVSDFLLSDSKGSFFATHIKHHYKSTKVKKIEVSKQISVMIPC